jgi:hypothetical protein
MVKNQHNFFPGHHVLRAVDDDGPEGVVRRLNYVEQTVHHGRPPPVSMLYFSFSVSVGKSKPRFQKPNQCQIRVPSVFFLPKTMKTRKKWWAFSIKLIFEFGEK